MQGYYVCSSCKSDCFTAYRKINTDQRTVETELSDPILQSRSEFPVTSIQKLPDYPTLSPWSLDVFYRIRIQMLGKVMILLKGKNVWVTRLCYKLAVLMFLLDINNIDTNYDQNYRIIRMLSQPFEQESDNLSMGFSDLFWIPLGRSDKPLSTLYFALHTDGHTLHRPAPVATLFCRVYMVCFISSP